MYYILYTNAYIARRFSTEHALGRVWNWWGLYPAYSVTFLTICNHFHLVFVLLSSSPSSDNFICIGEHWPGAGHSAASTHHQKKYVLLCNESHWKCAMTRTRWIEGQAICWLVHKLGKFLTLENCSFWSAKFNHVIQNCTLDQLGRNYSVHSPHGQLGRGYLWLGQY